MTESAEPIAPGSLPKYLADGLPKQDQETLKDVREYVDGLLEYKEQLDDQPIEADDLSGDVEIIEEESKGTIVIEHRTCGDESCHCMNGGEKHGPYKYRAYWEEGSVKKEYIGKTDV